MSKQRRKSPMLVPTLIMAVLALILLWVGYAGGEGRHISGLKSAWAMTISILPLLICAFIVAGMVQVLIPVEVISRWVGAESGIRGILLGSLAGGLAPGGPYVSFPLAAAFLRSGASIGTTVAFLTGWALWALARLPMEVGILGWKPTFAWIVSTCIFPPIAGLIAHFLFDLPK